MLEYSDEDGSDYEGVDEDFDEDSNTDSDYGYFDEDRDSDGDVPLDVLRTRLEDSSVIVRGQAFRGLSELEPATLAQHAHTLVAMLENSDWTVRLCALETLGELEPATLAQHALAVVARLEDSDGKVRQMACHTLTMLPRYVRHATRGVDSTFEELRSRLLGRIAWYRCRIRLRVRSLSLYWYALPYRPSGPGHARDLEAWNHMIEE